MNNLVNSPNKILYGAFELKKIYPKNFAKGLFIAFIWHFILISSYFIANEFTKVEKKEKNVIVISDPIAIPLPPINPTISVAVKTANISPLAIPIPVPDEKVPIDQTIESQENLRKQGTPILENAPTTFQFKPEIPEVIPIEETTDPELGKFVAVEHYPEVVVTSSPNYPEIPLKAGIQGVAHVSILVDKDGKPKKAVVVKTDSEMFNEAAIEAAMKFLFKPAIQNSKPIAVWVTIPFRFKID